ncbi:MAG: hypothetical protein ACRD0U_02325, partial [Acidimicrobiales bacterium]
MTDQPVSDATGAGYFARLAEFAGTVARWVARAALAGAIGAVCLGVAVWLLILLTDVAPGTVDIGLLFVCLVPAASFIGLWWALRRVVRDVPHFTDDMGQMVGEVRAMPGRLGGALDELQSARGLRARIAALRDAAGLLRGEAET